MIGIFILSLLSCFIFYFFIMPKKSNAHAIENDFSPAECLEQLIEGNKRYLKGEPKLFHENAIRRQHTAIHGQFPKAIVLACSDSRMPVETLLDQGNGDIFVIRVAGNVVGTQVLGSIDYGLSYLNTPLVLVLGHTSCGAICSAVDAVYSKKKIEKNIAALLAPLIKVVEDIKTQIQEPSLDEIPEIKEQAIINNIWQSVASIISSSAEVQTRIKENKLLVIGGLYNIESGEVQWFGTHRKQDTLINNLNNI